MGGGGGGYKMEWPYIKSLYDAYPFEREGGVEEKENQLHKCTQESQAPHPTLYFGYIILPLKMLTFLCTRSLLLSPSF